VQLARLRRPIGVASAILDIEAPRERDACVGNYRTPPLLFPDMNSQQASKATAARSGRCVGKRWLPPVLLSPSAMYDRRGCDSSAMCTGPIILGSSTTYGRRATRRHARVMPVAAARVRRAVVLTPVAVRGP
jgi:hypothetical protein